MPLIPPPTAQNTKPPWMKGPVNNVNNGAGPRGNEFVPPWRRNLRSVIPPQHPNNPQEPQLQQNVSSASSPETKTSKIQINLKSVKKPDPPNLPPTGKAIPILIQKESEPENKFVALKPTPKQVKVAPDQETKMPKGPPAPPAPPPPPGGAPPPPPPPAEVKTVKIEQLRKAPKKRPDWAGMMKEIEKGRVLKHVECNDRSKPILAKIKSHGKFVFESEAKPATKKAALHNILLDEIQKGVKLKKVVCNDRSKPILTGLRVRRQSSVLEELGDGSGAHSLEPVDELAFLDIDVLRDELQSAKQMLQTEIESKHTLEKKTRDQKCQIIEMEAEIETLKAKLGIIPEEDVTMLSKSDSKTFRNLRKSGSALWKSPSIVGIKKSKSSLAKELQKSGTSEVLNKETEEDLPEVNEMEEEIVSLKEAVQHARKQAEEMERKFKEAMAKLSQIQNNFEESEVQRKSLERKLSEATPDGKRASSVQTAERTTQTEEQILEKTAAAFARQQSVGVNEEEESEEEESDSDDIEVDEEAVQKKKQERELKLWENKVKSVKEKQHTSRVERKNLKTLQKKLEAELKDANKRHKKLQKEVDKMAKMLKEVEKEGEDEEDEEEEEEETEETEEEEEEEEEESEEEESESDDDEEEESSEDDQTGSYDDRLAVFNKKVKRRENVLNALRKGNYLLRANIDRLKDDLEEARIAYHDLEHELNSILDET